LWFEVHVFVTGEVRAFPPGFFKPSRISSARLFVYVDEVRFLLGASFWN